MSKVTPFLMFNDQAEEAVNLYTSLIPNSRILDLSRYEEGGPMPAGSLRSATFELDGRPFMAFNGGPYFSFSEGLSLFVECRDQAEVDRLWDSLTEGGEESQCGWLKDRFGVSWQIVPSALGEMMADPDPARAARVTEAMLKMHKIIIRDLERARDGA
jgi:predicted 3-demethylubiquinone-9 3-methyltransferase (glyoxalase superfamily)